MKLSKRYIKIWFFLIVLLTFSARGYGQIINIDSLTNMIPDLSQFLLYGNHDTSYIKNHSDKFSLKLVANDKYSYFLLRDRKTKNYAYYRQPRGLNLGAGIAYKWFAFDITFNTKVEEAENEKLDRSLDLQFRVYSSKHFLEGTLQYYDGYTLGGINTLTGRNDVQFRDDIRTISFGLQYLHVTNYKRFSLQAPFVMNEIQRKSAGSIITGLGYDMYTFNADSSAIPPPYQYKFNRSLNYTDLSAISLSFKIGYIYSFVFKEHFFFSLGTLPGVSYNIGDYYIDDRTLINSQFAFNIKSVSALGFNGEKLYSGVQFFGDAFNVRIDDKSNTIIGKGYLKFFVGYRFIRKQKRK